MKKLSDTEIVSAASIGAGKKRTGNNKKYLPRLIAVFIVLVMAAAAIPMLFSDTGAIDASGTESMVVADKYNFGGSGDDRFEDVIEVSGGFVAVGASFPNSFGNGDWAGYDSNDEIYNDAIIVKFDANGTPVWRNSFGGDGYDYFYDVIEVSGGFVAVGYSSILYHGGTGDWAGVTGKGYNDAIIVKFDMNGNVVWNSIFGGFSNDYFYAVTETSDGGYVAAGCSASLGRSGDWSDFTGKGGDDAIIVKFDIDGTAVWRNSFGCSGHDQFYGVTAVSDGFVAVGYAPLSLTMGNGDWSGVTSKGNGDATIVKFDTGGTAVWWNNFGGNGSDSFYAVTATGDGGFVAAGSSGPESFGGAGDWPGVSGKGNSDATIVKFDTDGNVVWNSSFGGNGSDQFNGVAAVSGGFVAVGHSMTTSFGGAGDWSNAVSKGGYSDATIVKFDTDGTAVWWNNFGCSGPETFLGAAETSYGYVAAGYSLISPDGDTGDWSGVNGKGNNDATIAIFGPPGLLYDTNGGNADGPAKDTAVQGTTHTLSTDVPTHPNMNGTKVLFAGWHSSPLAVMDKNGSLPEMPASIQITSASTTVYAVWAYDSNNNEIPDVSETKYIVTYSVNGGNADGPQDDTMLIEETNNVLNSTDIPTHPDVNGKKVLFAGWSETETAYIIDMSGTLPHMETSVEIENDDVTVYAVWAYDSNDNQIPDVDETKYAVRYEMNDGTGGSQDASGLSGMYALDAAVPARSGYIFMGWSETETADTGKYGSIPSTVGSVTITSSDIAVYAVWAEDLNNNKTPDANETKYTVMYDCNGGTGGPANEEGILSGPYSPDTASAAMPVRSGYVFMGWSETKAAPLNDSGSLPADMVTSMNVTGNATVYAVWALDADGIQDADPDDPGDVTGDADTENGGWVFPWYTLLMILTAVSAASLMISYRIR